CRRRRIGRLRWCRLAARANDAGVRIASQVERLVVGGGAWRGFHLPADQQHRNLERAAHAAQLVQLRLIGGAHLGERDAALVEDIARHLAKLFAIRVTVERYRRALDRLAEFIVLLRADGVALQVLLLRVSRRRWRRRIGVMHAAVLVDPAVWLRHCRTGGESSEEDEERAKSHGAIIPRVMAHTAAAPSLPPRAR